jgi:hypothetical protein
MKGILPLILMAPVFISACTQQSTITTTTISKPYSELTPKEVVELYFSSWNTRDYETMYKTVSDGFKRIDPNATSLEAFKNHLDKFFQRGRGVKLVKAEELLNDGENASVEYTIELDLIDRGKTEFSGSYSLKYRKNDTLAGWKLIHPYGENVDTS